jgi:hypothetical protein
MEHAHQAVPQAYPGGYGYHSATKGEVMTTEQKKVALKIAKELAKLATLADAYELLLQNGAIAGCLISGIALDLEFLGTAKEKA